MKIGQIMISLILRLLCSFLVAFLFLIKADGEEKCDSTVKGQILLGLNLVSAYPFPYTLKNEVLINIEPNIKIPFYKTKYFWSTSIGYTKYTKNPLYNNLDYRLQGGYLKTGVESNPDDLFSNGLALCIAQFNESGKFILEGNYFDNYEIPFPIRSKTILFIEPYFMLKIPLFKIISIEPRVNVDVFFKKDNSEIPTYYVPGSGYSNDLHFFNINVDFKLFIRI
jgi:hypothetical protein